MLDIDHHDHDEKLVHDGLRDVEDVGARFGQHRGNVGNDAHPVLADDGDDDAMGIPGHGGSLTGCGIGSERAAGPRSLKAVATAGLPFQARCSRRCSCHTSFFSSMRATVVLRDAANSRLVMCLSRSSIMRRQYTSEAAIKILRSHVYSVGGASGRTLAGWTRYWNEYCRKSRVCASAARPRPSRALSGNRCKAWLPRCPVRVSSRSAISRPAAAT